MWLDRNRLGERVIREVHHSTCLLLLLCPGNSKAQEHNTPVHHGAVAHVSSGFREPSDWQAEGRLRRRVCALCAAEGWHGKGWTVKAGGGDGGWWAVLVLGVEAGGLEGLCWCWGWWFEGPWAVLGRGKAEECFHSFNGSRHGVV